MVGLGSGARCPQSDAKATEPLNHFWKVLAIPSPQNRVSLRTDALILVELLLSFSTVAESNKDKGRFSIIGTAGYVRSQS